MSHPSKGFRLGIIQCDEVRSELKDVYGDYDQMIINAIRRTNPEIIGITYRVFDGKLPYSVDDCDGWIATGSRYSVNDNNSWTRRLENFVRDIFEASRPLVGICYGMQMIARALGGTVQLSASGWGIGVKTSQIHRREQWIDNALGDAVNLLVSHKEQVTSLPRNGFCIASSDTCLNSIIRVGSSMVGFQGHPEFSYEYARAMMDLRRDVIPAQTMKAGLDSLQIMVDNDGVFRSISQFLYTTCSKLRHT
jgi:GMP synthase-like glutamine amidotransferase